MLTTTTLNDLFLSYAWGKDGVRRPLARFIVAFLRANGYTVWFDEDHMSSSSHAQGGTDSAMATAIDASSALVILLSPEYATSANCRKESEHADLTKKPAFFVNVEAGWVPSAYNTADPAASAAFGWLCLRVGKALWADGRSGQAAWGAPGGGGGTLLGALGGDARVRRTAPPPPRVPAVRRLPLAGLAASAGGFSPAARIGVGATGEVFRGALDGAPVAVKVLKLPPSATLEARAALHSRFRAELDTLGAVQHTRIVRLLGYGEDEAPASRAPFALVFELLEEGSLGDWLCGADGAPPPRGATLSPAERVEAVAGAAVALYYLHGLTPPIMHRDVKSANIGLTRMGGALFSKLLDCGLAKALKAAPPGSAAAEGASFTGGLAAGTLGYMAPELTSGAYTERSEVYALGVVLLEALMGRRVGPNTAREVEKAARKGGIGSLVARADAAWPPAVAGKLAELAIRCIAADEEDRPESVEKVAAALAEVRELLPVRGTLPVSTAPLSPGKAPWDVFAALKGGKALPLGAPPLPVDTPAAVWKEVLGNDGPSSPAFAATEVESAYSRGGGSGAAPESPFARPPPTPPAPRAVKGRCAAKLRHGDVDVVALAVVEGVGLVSGGTAHIRAWAQGADRGLTSITGAAKGIAALPGRRFASAGGTSNLVAVWDAGSGKHLHQLRGHTGDVSCVAALPGGLLASGSADKTVRIWNVTAGAIVETLEGHTFTVSALAVLPDGRLASGSGDKTIRLWNVATCACIQVLPHPSWVNALAVLDGGRLASGCGDNRVYIWSLADGVQEAVLEGHTNAVYSLAPLLNGLFASGSVDETVRVWDVGARACVAVLDGHGGAVRALAALPDGRLASGSFNDHFVRLWALTAPDTPEDAAAVAQACMEVAPGPDATLVAELNGILQRTGGTGSRDERVLQLKKDGSDYVTRCDEEVARGSLVTLVTALKTCVEDEGVCASACAALRNITGADEKQANTAAEQGAIPLLVAALTRHGALGVVCTPACGALLNFSATHSLIEQVRSSGAVPALEAAFAAHKLSLAEKALQKLGCDEKGQCFGGGFSSGGGGGGSPPASPAKPVISALLRLPGGEPVSPKTETFVGGGGSPVEGALSPTSGGSSPGYAGGTGGGDGGAWHSLCAEHGIVDLPEDTMVRYGVGENWAIRILRGRVEASNGVFGDPAILKAKVLEQWVPDAPARRLRGHVMAKLLHCESVLALAVEGGVLVSAGEGFVRTWAPAGAGRGQRSAAGSAHALAVLPEGRVAAAGGPSCPKDVFVWDTAGGDLKCVLKLRGQGIVTCVAALPGGFVAGGDKDSHIRVWNTNLAAELRPLKGHTNWVTSLAALPDGRLASGSYDQSVRIWNSPTAGGTAKRLQHPHNVLALAVLDGGRLAAGCEDHKVHVWDLRSYASFPMEGHLGAVTSLAALPNGLLASGGGDGDRTVRVWDVNARVCAAVLGPRHSNKVVALAALPDGRLASGSWTDRCVHVWALEAAGTLEDAAKEAAVDLAAASVEVAPGPGAK